MDDADRQVVRLRLVHLDDMFEMPRTDLFSEYRNFLTGADFCISELRARVSRKPVLLHVELPPSEIDEGVADRFRYTLRRYCEHRIRYSVRERRALRIGGVSALRIGLPLAIAGMVLTWWANVGADSEEAAIVTDHLGWVLAWLGLWYPLDQLLFYPLAYNREQRVLTLLRDADVVIEPYRTARVEPRR